MNDELERNQNKRTLAESLRCGFFLRKKPLDGLASGHSYSGFAVDSLIDRALASYTPAEPRPGIEQRILASVAVAGHPRTWGWRPAWALAAAAAALVAVVAIPLAFKSMHPTVAVVHPAAVTPAAIAEARQSPPAVSAPANPARHAHAHLAAIQPAVPEAASKSSLALIATLAIAPIRNQPLTDGAIEFKPITIAPIRIAALN